MNNDFKLSRIQAEGWNAALKLSPADAAELDHEGRTALNPYAQGPEHDRWADGFDGALTASLKTPARGAPRRGSGR